MAREDPTGASGRGALAFTKELVRAIADLAEGAGGWGVEKAQLYLAFVTRAAVVFLFTAALLILALGLGVVMRQAWLVATAGLGIGLATAVVLLLATPLGTVAVVAGRAVEPARVYLKFVGGLLLWGLLLTLYFSVVPISANPAAILLVVLVALIFGLMWAVWGIGLDPRRVRVSVVSVLAITTVSFFFPKSFRATVSMRGRFDEALAQCISDLPACFRGDKKIELNRIRSRLQVGRSAVEHGALGEALDSLVAAEAGLRDLATRFPQSSELRPLQDETDQLLKTAYLANVAAIRSDVGAARGSIEQGAFDRGFQKLRDAEGDLRRVASRYAGSAELVALQSEVARSLREAYSTVLSGIRRGLQSGDGHSGHGAYGEAAAELRGAETLVQTLAVHYPDAPEVASLHAQIVQRLEEIRVSGLAAAGRQMEAGRASTERGAYVEAIDALRGAETALQRLAGSYPSSPEFDSLAVEIRELTETARSACMAERNVALRRGAPAPTCR